MICCCRQTETPADLERRNAERKRAGQKTEKVVNREKVAVLSTGTLVDAEMVAGHPEAAYVVAGAQSQVAPCCWVLCQLAAAATAAS